MTGAECRALRQSVNWSQMRLATHLDRELSSVSRWERGEVPIDRVTEIAIKAVIAEEAAKQTAG